MRGNVFDLPEDEVVKLAEEFLWDIDLKFIPAVENIILQYRTYGRITLKQTMLLARCVHEALSLEDLGYFPERYNSDGDK